MIINQISIHGCHFHALSLTLMGINQKKHCMSIFHVSFVISSLKIPVLIKNRVSCVNTKLEKSNCANLYLYDCSASSTLFCISTLNYILLNSFANYFNSCFIVTDITSADLLLGQSVMQFGLRIKKLTKK